MEKVTSLVFVRQGNHVLLGMKKRGFGEGRWNGFGGKLQPGETALEAAKRELEEESGIIGESFEECAHLFFDFETTPDTIECTVFFCDTFSGTPRETDEMRPQWFPVDALPFESMWSDDRYWVPQVFAGKKLEAIFHFKDLVEIKDFSIKER